eukprot:427359-Prymnesium_polylepis.2
MRPACCASSVAPAPRPTRLTLKPLTVTKLPYSIKSCNKNSSPGSAKVAVGLPGPKARSALLSSAAVPVTDQLGGTVRLGRDGQARAPRTREAGM